MKHILIVGNDPIVQKTAEHTLQKKYKISLLTSGNRISEFIAQNNTDLILVDASSQLMDSLDTLISMVNKEMNEIPIIILTNQNDGEAEKWALTTGTDFITKPFLPETMMTRVNAYVDLQEYRNDSTQAEKFQDAISVSFAELVEFRDVTTGGHLKNTTLYFRILLEEVAQQDKYKDTISMEDVNDLLRSAPLHDIGKIGINDDILRKASSLDNNEYEYMKTHTTLGKQAFEKIISKTGGTRWLYLAKDIAYCHHERWDGKGYPNGLKGEQIPLYARILTIADVYDALTSRRTYKEAFTHQKAIDIIMEGKGVLFDPTLVDIFMKANQRFEQACINKK